jgi:septal ring factor EnvC (AmiA/AmiB activator)
MELWIIIIALLLIAVALGWVLERKFDEAGRLGRDNENLRRERGEHEQALAKFQETLAKIEKDNRQVDEMVTRMREQRDTAQATARNLIVERDGFMQQLAETRRKTAPRVARLRLEGLLPPEQVQAALANHRTDAVVRAVLDHVARLMVEASDLASDEPRETIATPERIIQGFNSDQRLHAAGKACALAELLADLQRLTAAKDEEEAA